MAYDLKELDPWRYRWRQMPAWSSYRYEVILYYRDGMEEYGQGNTLNEALANAVYVAGYSNTGHPLTWGDLIRIRPDILD